MSSFKNEENTPTSFLERVDWAVAHGRLYALPEQDKVKAVMAELLPSYDREDVEYFQMKYERDFGTKKEREVKEKKEKEREFQARLDSIILQSPPVEVVAGPSDPKHATSKPAPRPRPLAKHKRVMVDEPEAPSAQMTVPDKAVNNNDPPRIAEDDIMRAEQKPACEKCLSAKIRHDQAPESNTGSKKSCYECLKIRLPCTYLINNVSQAEHERIEFLNNRSKASYRKTRLARLEKEKGTIFKVEA